MRQGSGFDSVHLFCEKHNVWTNLRGFGDGSRCLDDDGQDKESNSYEKGEGDQLSLF